MFYFTLTINLGQAETTNNKHRIKEQVLKPK